MGQRSKPKSKKKYVYYVITYKGKRAFDDTFATQKQARATIRSINADLYKPKRYAVQKRYGR